MNEWTTYFCVRIRSHVCTVDSFFFVWIICGTWFCCTVLEFRCKLRCQFPTIKLPSTIGIWATRSLLGKKATKETDRHVKQYWQNSLRFQSSFQTMWFQEKIWLAPEPISDQSLYGSFLDLLSFSPFIPFPSLFLWLHCPRMFFLSWSTTHNTNIYVSGGIRTRNCSKRAATDHA